MFKKKESVPIDGTLYRIVDSQNRSIGTYGSDKLKEATAYAAEKGYRVVKYEMVGVSTPTISLPMFEPI